MSCENTYRYKYDYVVGGQVLVEVVEVHTDRILRKPESALELLQRYI